MTKYNKIVQLKPRKIYFNAYSDKYLTIRNSNFWDNLRYKIHSKYITTYVIKQNKDTISEEDLLLISCEQICSKGIIVINESKLTLKQFIEKLSASINEESLKVTFDIDYEMTEDKFFCRKVCNASNFFCNFAKKHISSLDGLKLIFEFDKEEVKDALEYYNNGTHFVQTSTNLDVEEVQVSNTIIENSTNTTSQSLFSFSNMDCGILDDENLVSTVFGIAINRNGSLYVFDKEKKRMVSMPKIAFTNFPIYVVPTTILKYGDLIKLDEKYYYFLKKYDGRITVLDALTDTEKNIYAAQNILEFTVYSKIITILDLK